MGDRSWTNAVRRWSAALAIFAMVAGAIGIAAAMILTERPPAPGQRTAAPRTTLPPPPSVPTPAEFTIAVVVTGQQCPPAAACVYTYTIEPKYIGLHPLPATPFTVMYQVTGGHQPQQGDFTVENGQAKILKDVPVEGPPGARLAAAVTAVKG